MSAFVKLPKLVTARLYCICFIAERSVDFAATNLALWYKFLAFFTPERRKWFEDLAREIPSVTAPSLHHIQNVQRNLFRIALLQLWAFLRPCPKIFAFNEAEIGFIHTTLVTFQELLRQDVPDVAVLTATRRNLGMCQWIVEKKWLHQASWNWLRRANHFCRNSALGEPLGVDEAVGKFLEK